MSLLRAWKLRGVEKTLTEAFPDLVWKREDNGNTIGCKLPEMEDGFYVRRVFIPSRDHLIGYWEVDDTRVQEIIANMVEYRLAAYQEEERRSLATIDVTTREDSAGSG